MGQCNFLHLWHQKLYRAFRFGTLWPISCSYPRHSQLTRHSLMLANGHIRQSLTALVVFYYGFCWLLIQLNIDLVWFGFAIRGHFYQHGLISIPAWISNYIHYKVWDGITFVFPNFYCAVSEVCEWISNFIPQFIGPMTTYRWWVNPY